MDKLFDPSDYLVSPFNSTSRFIAGEYFLTNQQEEVRSQIVDSLEQQGAARFISIVGSAGTGKTLLTYDIAKHFIETNRKPLIIHCGQLNDGHQKLIAQGWTISPIKNYEKHDFSNFGLVVIDEAQRISQNQLKVIVKNANLAKCCCIFSHDKRQTLARWEKNSDISGNIKAIDQIKEYKLSDRIRTNREIASFIKMLFNKTRSIPFSSNGNIEINHFHNPEDAKAYLDSLDGDKWEALQFTPSQYNKEHHEEYGNQYRKTAHKVIGQEFDGVAVTIDRFFSYDKDGNLTYRAGTYYDPPNMLFQNITRARERLNLVIINNEELLMRCIAILR